MLLVVHTETVKEACGKQWRFEVMEREKYALCLFICLITFLSYTLHRLFGISPIIKTNCSSTWKLIVYPGLNWHHFVNPIMLLVLYYTLATLIRLWLQDPMIMVNTLYFLQACILIPSSAQLKHWANRNPSLACTFPKFEFSQKWVKSTHYGLQHIEGLFAPWSLIYP